MDVGVLFTTLIARNNSFDRKNKKCQPSRKDKAAVELPGTPLPADTEVDGTALQTRR
jgi:hypothetical protein